MKYRAFYLFFYECTCLSPFVCVFSYCLSFHYASSPVIFFMQNIFAVHLSYLYQQHSCVICSVTVIKGMCTIISNNCVCKYRVSVLSDYVFEFNNQLLFHNNTLFFSQYSCCMGNSGHYYLHCMSDST